MIMAGYLKISIVTPSYNQEKFLERTILSVLDQEYPNLEYIIMDGGSTDGSVEIIKRYESYLKYWRSESDAGQTSAIKEGFERATGDILCWLNSDDMFLSGALKTVASVFSENQRIQLLAGNCIHIDADDRYLFTYYAKSQTYKHMLRTNMLFAQPATFWLKEIYHKVGGITASFYNCMDYDLFLRIAKQAGRIYTVPKIFAAYRIHAESKLSKIEGALSSRKVHDQEWDSIRRAHGVTPTYLGKRVWGIRMRAWRTQRRMKNFFFNRRNREIWNETLLQLRKRWNRHD